MPKYFDFEDTGKLLNETARTTDFFSSSPTNQSLLDKSVLPAPQGALNVQMFSRQSTTMMKNAATLLLHQKRGVEKRVIAAKATHGLSKDANALSSLTSVKHLHC